MLKYTKIILRGLVVCFVVFFALCLFGFMILSMFLPDVSSLEALTMSQSSQIFDREGNLLYTIYGEENRETVAYSEISPYLVNATVAIEDDRFFSHFGFDILGIGKAIAYEIFGWGTQRGGSTITQQYAKNAFLTSEKTYIRKLKEIVLALNLEFFYNKEKILELYLNRIPYGNNAYGAKNAAKVYFADDVKHLSLAESIVLASLPQAPSRYNPYGENRYTQLLKEFTEDDLMTRQIKSESDLAASEYSRGLLGSYFDLADGSQIYIPGRADLVLNRMYELNMIGYLEKLIAFNDLQNIEFAAHVQEIKHPHFVFYIIQMLEDKYGREFLERGGLKIYTTLDPNLQAFVEDLSDKKQAANLWNFGADNMAILTTNIRTGEILAMLGSVDYYNKEIDGEVNVVMRPRQPGSSFKPFVYAKAFLMGYSPAHIIYDVPMKIGDKKPQNYDGKFMGELTIRKALGQSRNIPAIKAYYLAEEQNGIIDLASEMGISSLNPEHDYGYPLALGAGEVSLFEMVQGFSVFANNGQLKKLTGILRIEDSLGNIIEELDKNNAVQVLDQPIAYLINSILSDKTVAVGSKLFVKGQINAAKTGTSTKETKSSTGSKTVRPGDNWTIGYTPSYATGVWIGNTDGRGLYYRANGYDAAAPIFNSVMTELLKDKAQEPFVVPDGIVFKRVSKVSGLLAGYSTPKNYISNEPFAKNYYVPEKWEYGYFSAGVRVNYKRAGAIADKFFWAKEIRNFYIKN